MIQDFRYAFRSLRKSPGFTIAAVLTLALGIGANTAIFSVVNAVLIRPLPYQDADRLMLIYTTHPGEARDYVSQPDLDDWRAHAQSFSGMLSLVTQSVNLTGADQPERVIGSFVSANYFDVLEVRAAQGRAFAPGEDREGAAPVAILTDAIWRNRFGGDANILGRALNFNGEAYTVAGILPAGFIDSPWNADVYLPARKYPDYKPDRGSAIGAVIARLRPGVSVSQAQAEMSGIAARLAAAYPATNRDRGVYVDPLKEAVVRNVRPAVTGLAFAVAFVLLIGCANVAGLLASRMMARERERSIRIALGASGAQLMAHVLAEAAVLAAAGGTAGLALAFWGVRALSRSIVNYLPNGAALTLDGSVLGFTAGAAAITALLIAVIPAWKAAGARFPSDSRGAGAGASRNRARGVLVAGEIALALVLLVGAGLTLKSLFELGRAQLGFDPRNLISFEYRVPAVKYPSAAAKVEFHRRVIEEIRSIPGVLDASSVIAVPLGGNGEDADFFPGDRPEPPASNRPRGLLNAADPYFFSTMRIPVLRGRVFNQRDSAGAPAVVVINRTLAERFFSDRDPVGRQLRIPGSNLTAEIIGVVGDVKQFGPEDPPRPQIYGSLEQDPFVFTSVAVRTAGDPEWMTNQIRRAVWRVDKDQPMWKMRTVDARLAMLAAPREFVTGLLGSYAALALLLAAIGIFGVVSYSVRQRTAEIGVRIALGASSGDIAGMILRQGLAMTLAGIAAGAGTAAWVARYLRSQLYSVSPLDVSVYLGVAALLALVAMAACLIPARRAMAIDPMQALRNE
jgi:putative ABC transport system permease protein